MSQLRIAQQSSAVARPRVALSWPVQLGIICALALYAHSLMWWTEPRDMSLFLRPWFQHIVDKEPVGAFAHPFSNYTPAYLYLLAVLSLFHQSMDAMYLIKLLSVAGTAFGAFALADLVGATGGQRRYALLLFVLPSSVLNTALLAQCDAIWAGACILAVAAMIRGWTVRSLFWCGVAIAFKAQAIFLAPFIIGALIGRRAPWWQCVIPAVVFAAVMLPAWLAGWPAWDLATIYVRQPEWIPFANPLANPWMFATMFAPRAGAQLYLLGYAAVGAAWIAVAALTSTSVQRPRAMLLLALLSSLAIPFFFPKMLERYYFLADLLSLALAVSYFSRSAVCVAISVQLASLLSLLSYMYFYANPWPTLVGAVFATIALITIFVLARRSGAEWPRLSAPTGLPHPALGGRTAA